MSTYEVVIAGGGPAGLSAALILGRARKRVLLCDAGVPRNAAAQKVHGFVTRDGTPPRTFRAIAREQLTPYGSVDVRDVLVDAVEGTSGDFELRLTDGTVRSRRVLLCSGLVDEVAEIPGLREAWGQAVFACPYCHGWEVQDQRFAFLARSPEELEGALLLRGWTSDVVAFTDGRIEVPDDARRRLDSARVGLEERPIRRIVSHDHRIECIELADGTRIERDVVFTRPQQRQTDLVTSLDLALDEQGFVRVDDQMQTSAPGVFAAGDLTTMFQGALLAASAGARAAYAINRTLTVELALAGRLG